MSKSLKSKKQHLNSISFPPSGSRKNPFFQEERKETDEKGKLLNKLIEKVVLSRVSSLVWRKESRGRESNVILKIDSSTVGLQEFFDSQGDFKESQEKKSNHHFIGSSCLCLIQIQFAKRKKQRGDDKK